MGRETTKGGNGVSIISLAEEKMGPGGDLMVKQRKEFRAGEDIVDTRAPDKRLLL